MQGFPCSFAQMFGPIDTVTLLSVAGTIFLIVVINLVLESRKPSKVE